MAERLVGFPTKPGIALIKASAKFKVPRVPSASKLPKGATVKVSKPKMPKGLY